MLAARNECINEWSSLNPDISPPSAAVRLLPLLFIPVLRLSAFFKKRFQPADMLTLQVVFRLSSLSELNLGMRLNRSRVLAFNPSIPEVLY